MAHRITQETHGRAQEQRVARAFLEGGVMLWTLTGEGWIVTAASGNSYRVSEQSCTCRDYQERCKGTEVRCKHSIALAHKLLAEGPLPIPAPKPWDAGLPEAERAAFERIFGW
jgi:hypothetical protein